MTVLETPQNKLAKFATAYFKGVSGNGEAIKIVGELKKQLGE